MEIAADVTPELEAELLARAPWMHRYRLGPETIVGSFKYHGIDETVCVSSSPPELVERLRTAYEAYREGDPDWQVRALAVRLGGLGGRTFLDIASASGRFSLTLADHGAGDVLGVEIRPEQVAQAELIRGLDAARFAGVRFEHEPASADDPGFRAGEQYDVVLSMGLLYHLTDPLRHLLNLRRLSREAALVHTMTHARERGFWLLLEEDPGEITKAVGGVAWVPHHADVPELLRRAGFARVEVLASPELAALQRWDEPRGRAVRAALPGAFVSLAGRARSRAYARRFEAALRRGLNARYYTYLANV